MKRVKHSTPSDSTFERSRIKSVWAVCTTPEVLGIALACAKGEYQREIILGRECVDGSTLPKRIFKAAPQYGRTPEESWEALLPQDREMRAEPYRRSRKNLLRRVSEKVSCCVLDEKILILGVSGVNDAWVTRRLREEADIGMRWQLRMLANREGRKFIGAMEAQRAHSEVLTVFDEVESLVGGFPESSEDEYGYLTDDFHLTSLDAFIPRMQLAMGADLDFMASRIGSARYPGETDASLRRRMLAMLKFTRPA